MSATIFRRPVRFLNGATGTTGGTGLFKEIADAIRAKEGSTDLIAPSQFAAHILAL